MLEEISTENLTYQNLPLIKKYLFFKKTSRATTFFVFFS